MLRSFSRASWSAGRSCVQPLARRWLSPPYSLNRLQNSSFVLQRKVHLHHNAVAEGLIGGNERVMCCVGARHVESLEGRSRGGRGLWWCRLLLNRLGWWCLPPRWHCAHPAAMIRRVSMLEAVLSPTPLAPCEEALCGLPLRAPIEFARERQGRVLPWRGAASTDVGVHGLVDRLVGGVQRHHGTTERAVRDYGIVTYTLVPLS